MLEYINRYRRRFLGTTAAAVVAAQLGKTKLAGAQSGIAQPTELAIGTTNTSFNELKQIDAGLLNVGYAEVGPTDVPSARLAIRHSQLRRCRSTVGVSGI